MINRRQNLRDALVQELDTTTQRRGLDLQGRIKWLCEELANYVERWIGFCAVVGNIPNVKNDVQFSMIEAGAEVLDAELKQLCAPPAVQESWQSFLTTLDSIRAGELHGIPTNLGEELKDFVARLPNRSSQFETHWADN